MEIVHDLFIEVAETLKKKKQNLEISDVEAVKCELLLLRLKTMKCPYGPDDIIELVDSGKIKEIDF